MKAHTITVYKFSELSKEAQEKAVQNRIAENLENSFWEDVYARDIIEDYKEILKEKGFCVGDNQIYYAGFSFQGAGASFDVQDIDLELFLTKNNLLSVYGELIPYIQNGEITAGIEDLHSRYVHECSRKIVVDTAFDEEEMSQDVVERLYSLVNALETGELEEKRKELCCALYKELEESYMYFLSEESARDELEREDDEQGERFLKDGSFSFL